ncbi:uncharacterized protein LOC143291536 [Babylonia areolata]|uniref:uncharacterized protein LOC143291536 n=1 Tax=Babylonia areolata TaxID=304850 RepID=UPI003FD11BAC
MQLVTVVVCLLCTSVACSAVKAGRKVVGSAQQQKRRPTKEDFSALFRKDASQHQDPLTTRLATTTVRDAFDDVKGQVRDDFDDIMTAREKALLRRMKTLRCPDGAQGKVFNLSRVALKTAVQDARRLMPLLTGPPPGKNVSQENLLETQGDEDPENVEGDTVLPDNDEDPGNPERNAEEAGGAGRTPEAVSLLDVLCWKGSREELHEVLDTHFPLHRLRAALRPKLVALLSNPMARRLEKVLPTNASRALCEEAKVAATLDLLSVTRRFPCHQWLRDGACSPRSVLAEALVQGKKERGLGRLSRQEWVDLIDQFGNCTPSELLRHAPVDQIDRLFPKLLTKDSAVVLISRKNLKTATPELVRSLGPRICSLPTASLLSIPTDSLEQSINALSCMQKERNRNKRTKLARKMLNPPDRSRCRRYLRAVDVTEERCWRLLTLRDLLGFNLTRLQRERLEEVSCRTVRVVKRKLGLRKVSRWTEDQVDRHQWMLPCLIVSPSSSTSSSSSSDQLDTQDLLDTLADTLVRGKVHVEGLHIPKAMKRSLLKKTMRRMLPRGGQLDAAQLRRLGPVVGALGRREVEQLSAEAVGQTLAALQKEFLSMGKPARRALLRKLPNDQVKDHLCDLEDLAGDVPVDTLMDATDLGRTLLDTDHCKFRCRHRAQCAAVYRRLRGAVGGDWGSAGRKALDRARDTRALCAMPWKHVIELQPDPGFLDVAAAFLNTDCDDPNPTTPHPGTSVTVPAPAVRREPSVLGCQKATHKRSPCTAAGSLQRSSIAPVLT